MEFKAIFSKSLNFLQNYSWFLVIIFYLQGTVYYSEYLQALKVDPDFYPLNFESAMLYALEIYLNKVVLSLLLAGMAVGVLLMTFHKKITELIASLVRYLTKRISRKVEERVEQKAKDEVSAVERKGFTLTVFCYSLLFVLFFSFLPAGLAGKINAKIVLERAKQTIQIMKGEEYKNSGSIEIKCESIKKSHPGPYVVLKNSPTYHSLYNGQVTITIPNSCVEFYSKNHN